MLATCVGDARELDELEDLDDESGDGGSASIRQLPSASMLDPPVDDLKTKAYSTNIYWLVI